MRTLALACSLVALTSLAAACAEPEDSSTPRLRRGAPQEAAEADEEVKADGEQGDLTGGVQGLVAGSAGGLCAPSLAPTDGCTTMDIEYVYPRVAAFKGTFTGECVAHDRCYGTLGASADECDAAFRSAMLNRCNDKFNKYLRPVEWSECRIAAEEFHAGVRLYGYATSAKGFASYQADARSRSKTLAALVEAETCGTTPERTQLYHPRLIADVDARFRSKTGRAPTIFEFLEAVHAGDPTGDAAAWGAAVDAYAGTRAGITPPAVGYTHSNEEVIVLTATPWSPEIRYRWSLPGRSATMQSVTIPLRRPKYTQYWQLTGFLVATDSSGNRNMAVVSETIVDQGWCAGKPGTPCQIMK